jgi:type IV pilus assembly protein PilY1
MSSAFFIFDITNPESPPTLLGEISFDGLGFTTCYPAVIPMNDKDLVTGAINANNWYLVLGSGPAAAGGTADSTALANASSAQSAKLYIIDLIKLAANREVWTLNSSGTLTTGENVFQEFTADNNSFISDPISVDFNLDYSADALYFGTISGNETSGWGGKLRRVVIDNDLTTSNWAGDSTLIDLEPNPSGLSNGQPIVAAPSVALDSALNRWVFFGTGRFFTRTDAANADQQSYYGIKEPKDTGGAYTWNSVIRSNLLDVTTAKVYEGGGLVENVTSATNWGELLTASQNNDGWLIDFTVSKERNLGQATLLGDILTFTTYIPSLDPCEFEGETYLYALYYLTGTAFYESVVGTETDAGGEVVLGKVTLGKGLSITPNIHLGREEGSKAFVQTSTGAIQTIDQINPGLIKSGISSWREAD